MNLKFTNAINGTTNKCPPIWMMRQAGRYHSHYQNLRKSHSFVELCKKPNLAAETAMGPIMDFDFDVAILFSDLLFPLESLGMPLSYESGGPQLGKHLDTGLLKEMKVNNTSLEKIMFQKDAVAETRKVLPKDKSLIGFVGGPWTLFTYAVEGSHKGGLEVAKRETSSLWPHFSEIMLQFLVENIKLQIAGGAEVVMILDTAAGELAPFEFTDWVLPGINYLHQQFPGKIGYYAKTANMAIFNSFLGKGVGVDHRLKIQNILSSRKFKFVQGNFDQSLTCVSNSDFEQRLRRYLEPIAQLSNDERTGWICGVGHGLIPSTREENVKSFVRIVRETFA